MGQRLLSAQLQRRSFIIQNLTIQRSYLDASFSTTGSLVLLAPAVPEERGRRKCSPASLQDVPAMGNYLQFLKLPAWEAAKIQTYASVKQGKTTYLLQPGIMALIQHTCTLHFQIYFRARANWSYETQRLQAEPGVSSAEENQENQENPSANTGRLSYTGGCCHLLFKWRMGLNSLR